MRLIVVHSHYRPGGVRRVMETALPSILREVRPRIREVILVGGEAPEPAWTAMLGNALAPVPLRLETDAVLGYVAELRGAAAVPGVARRVRAALARRLVSDDPAGTLVWAHNQSLARNLFVTRALLSLQARHGFRLVLHHHDWWFDHRWQRWSELRRSGLRTLPDVARLLVTRAAGVRHALINSADAAVLARHLPGRSAWLPNPVEPAPAPPVRRLRLVRRWLADEWSVRGPVWILPCRLLRRKNVAEALLWTRWLRPDATLVTTGGVSSADERPYAEALADASEREGWRLRLGVLRHRGGGQPGVAELIAASETVLLTSLVEGFGLPYLEAVAAGRPLLARALPNVAPDLARFGFRFEHLYDEVWVDASLFDERAERARQTTGFARWRKSLPRGCRGLAGEPWLLSGAEGAAVPFSRLSLKAQMEVLHVPADVSFERCARWNPRLRLWREAAEGGGLDTSTWPSTAARWIGGRAFGRAFSALTDVALPPPVADGAELRVQMELMTAKLASENQYPLLWSSKP